MSRKIAISLLADYMFLTFFGILHFWKSRREFILQKEENIGFLSPLKPDVKREKKVIHVIIKDDGIPDNIFSHVIFSFSEKMIRKLDWNIGYSTFRITVRLRKSENFYNKEFAFIRLKKV